MKRLLHLSDLHFGRTRPDLLDPLLETVADLAPDIVVVSGDFTQRARDWQYREARAFLDRIEQPVLSVPGNHDTPLDNPVLRFLRPWHRYKKFISHNLEPTWSDDDMIVVGINTVNRFSWQRGKIGQRTLRRIGNAFGPEKHRTTVAVMHHPLEHGPEVEKQLMRGARAALRALGEAGADVVLSGHLHNTRVSPFTAEPGVLFVQAGTGLSTRLRGEDNTFNLLHIGDDEVVLDRFGAAANETSFARIESARFLRDGSGWRQST